VEVVRTTGDSACGEFIGSLGENISVIDLCGDEARCRGGEVRAEDMERLGEFILTEICDK
jgi:hypothetical protein